MDNVTGHLVRCAMLLGLAPTLKAMALLITTPYIIVKINSKKISFIYFFFKNNFLEKKFYFKNIKPKKKKVNQIIYNLKIKL